MFTTALKHYQVWLVILAVVNAIISIFYYFRVIVAMYFRDAERTELVVPVYYKLVLGFSALATILIGVYPEVISKFF
jgi:NADH-quinone oxidoreductase subunit N